MTRLVRLLTGAMAIGAFMVPCAAQASGASQLPTVRSSIRVSSARDYYYAVTIIAHQFNMCSVDCGAGNGTKAQDLVAYFKAEGPWTISVNEACYADVSALVTRLGMPAEFVAADTAVSGCSGIDKRFGNAVFYLGTLIGSSQRLTFQTQNPSPCTPGPNECRAAICVNLSTYAGNVTSCSAHLRNGDTTTAAAQANEYNTFAALVAGSSGRWLAGDFNLEPTQVPSVFASTYYRSPISNTYSATLPSKQFDYVWHDQAHSASNVLRTPHCDPYYSDHCYAFSQFT